MFRLKLSCLQTMSLVMIPVVAFTLAAIAVNCEKDVSHSFKVKIDGNMVMKIADTTQKLRSDTELFYTWNVLEQERILSLDSTLVKARVNDEPVMNIFMSREKLTAIEEGIEVTTLIEDAPVELRAMLQDSFDSPLFKLQVNSNGEIVKRTVIAKPGAKALIDNGMIANATIFHPPFLNGKNQWQADSEFSMGNGGYAKGMLTYKLSDQTESEQIFKISGSLTNESYKHPGTPMTLKKVLYKVSGSQTYNTHQQEWITGKITINASYQMYMGGRTVGSTKGTMVLSFQKLPDK